MRKAQKQNLYWSSTTLCFSAYHGHTNLLMDISPYKQKQMNKTCDKDFVHVITSPDPYRGKYRGYTEETGVKYANEVKETVENVQKNGRKVSALLHCTKP